MPAPDYFIEGPLWIEDLSKNMYLKYTAITHNNAVINDAYREMIWWEVTVSESITGDFEAFTYIPLSTPIRGMQ